MKTNRFLSTIEEEEKEDDIWTPEIEAAFQEALVLYPRTRRIELNGKLYGKNNLISLHIKNKCGKIRTRHQIASHIQVLFRRRKAEEAKQNEILQEILPSYNKLVIPTSFSNLLSQTDSGAIKFQRLYEDHNTEQYFTDTLLFLSNVFDQLKYRRVSGEKLALLSVMLYTKEQSEYTDLIYSNTITRGFTCIADSIMPDVHINQIKHHFGQDLEELYKKTPKSAFYLVKSWNNWDFPKDDSLANFIWDNAFYSPYLLDIEYNVTKYIKGRPLCKFLVDHMEVDEVVNTDQEKYYIYQTRVLAKNEVRGNSYNKIQNIYQTHLKKVIDFGDAELTRVIMKNQSRLIVLTDQNTREVLLVVAVINDYIPFFTGYQYFRIVD